MHSEPTRVLLVEDDSADYQLIKRCLNKAHSQFHLQLARTLQQARQLLERSAFDVVLTDLSLPDCQGLEAVEAIRSRHRSLPVVVMTTLDDSEVELRSLDVGAQDYLLKDDATPYTLERAIHHAMQRQDNLVQINRLLAEVERSRQLLAEQKELLERKNRRLRKLYRTAHRFVDNVSHEFRTPLTVIKDYVALVREGVVGEVNDEQSRMLDVAGVRVDDLNNMVDDMLDVSKLESGLLGAWRRSCELGEVVREIRHGLDKKAQVKGIDFVTEVPEDGSLPAVYCDGEKIGRVIINLVTNAMKFCGDPGRVRLAARPDRKRREVVVSVEDNGAGISEEGLSEIFRRFRQLRSSIKSSTKGFGLGLNIAKELVDLNFGEMQVESEVGHGSIFSFTIPFAEPLEVMRRYLDRIQHMRSESSVITLVQACVAEDVSCADADDADAFFNFLLRRNDLLFRCETHRWLFILPTPRAEIENFFERAQKEWQKTNRNRPFELLPEFHLSEEGCWRVPEDRDAILENVREAIEGAVAHA